MQRNAVYRNVFFAALVLCAASTAAYHGAAAQAPATKAVPVMTQAECEVWARELSFAQSVVDHDAAAFASHLDQDAVFGASLVQPTRGREAIARQWAPVVEGKQVKLSWYPVRTTIGGVPDVAWSSGPALFENPDPKAPHRYRIGGFHSVWHRGADGVWRVMFDDGIEPVSATDEQVAAFHAGRQAACPQG
jgi:ketosteroid isomerase-like protein